MLTGRHYNNRYINNNKKCIYTKDIVDFSDQNQSLIHHDTNQAYTTCTALIKTL